MPNCNIVIGAGLGDCGKGRVVDALTTPNTLVVRFNGGCQAGHTVKHKNLSHIFHHVGSGTLKGAPTFLSQYFIINPIMFRKEWEELAQKGIKPVVYADPRCMVTTPFDMIINQVLEMSRGDKRHGSVGLGINETIVRHEYEQSKSIPCATALDTTYYRLTSCKCVRAERMHLFSNIQKHHVPLRCSELGISIPKSWQDMSMEILDHYMEDVTFFFEHCTLVYPEKIIFKDHSLLFEGAQGLRLDMDSPDFPHVTRSKTGLTNVLALLNEINYKGKINVFYVTRPYITRHGAGPLPHPAPNPPYVNVTDDTNLPNEWQGEVRYGWLDLPRLVQDITQDVNKFKAYPDLSNKTLINMVITCADHLNNDRLMFYDNENNLLSSPLDCFIPLLKKCMPYLYLVGVSRSAYSEDEIQFY